MKQVAGLVFVSVDGDARWYILFLPVPVSLIESCVTVHMLPKIVQECATFIFTGLWTMDVLYSSWTVSC
jgi:hypothetical protein